MIFIVDEKANFSRTAKAEVEEKFPTKFEMELNCNEIKLLMRKALKRETHKFLLTINLEGFRK